MSAGQTGNAAPAAATDSASASPANIMSAGCAWIDGEYVPISEARIPIMDWGFQRSDATYDVVGVWDGSFFRLDDHIERLARSRSLLHMSSPVGDDEIKTVLNGVVAHSGLRNSFVQGMNTRGTPPPGGRDPRAMTPAFYAFAIPYQWVLAPEEHDAGLDLIVARGNRRTPPDAVDPTIKRMQWGDMVRGMFEAYDRGGRVPLMTDGGGNVTEGPGFNVFAVIDGVLHTPDSGVLLGITRRTVIEIVEADGREVRVEPLSVEQVEGAEELFLTSTAGGVIPVGALDGVSKGGCGPVTRHIRERYWELHHDPRYLTAVDYRINGI